MAAYSQLSLTPLLDDAGRPLVGAMIELFDAGTLTPKLAYQDSGLTTQHPRPILTGSSGRIPSIWTTGNDYRARLSTATGVLIDDVDGIAGDVSSGPGGGGGGGSDTAIETGDVIWSYRTGTRGGWVRMNGRTIGSDVSGASERANADCQALFVFLWNQDGSLAVSGGRGTSAANDWSANKTIALPPGNGVGLFGLDDMGAVSAGRLVGATFAYGAPTTLGSVGGAGVVTLDSTMIPSHQHTGTTNADGYHQHTGSTYGAGGHSHTGTTDGQGDHTHNVSSNYLGFAGGTGGNAVSSLMAAGGSGNTPTLNAGTHAHNLNVGGVGDHVHVFVTDAGGYHTHAFTTAAAGGGLAHNNMPPFLLGTWYMRL